MERNLERALARSVVRTFEDLAFLMPDDDLDPVQSTAKWVGSAEVRFEGFFSGRLILSIYGPEVLASAAQNMLGDITTPPLEVQWDTLKELANVLCGNLLPELAGREAVFNLHPPELLEAVMWDANDSAAGRIRLGLDCGRIEAFLFVDNESATSGGEA